MKTHASIVIRSFLLSLVKFLASGVRVALVLWVLFTSCTPNAIQPSIPHTPSPKVNGTAASEINNALATIARNTSLPTADYQIGPEDLLQITVFNIPEADVRITPRTTTVRVSQQGMISLPLIGEIKVAGLTPSGLERELRNQYDKYIYSPLVGVLVTDYRQRVSLIGSVQKTGVFELSGPKTVIDILAMAGGVTEKAGTQVHIYRQGPNGRESHVIDLLALASNATLINASNAGLITMPVQGGDVINVPPAGTFFVDGAVRNPGPYPLGRRYTLTQALTTAGGVDRDLYSADITIFRRTGTAGLEPISVDLSAIWAGSVTDPQIEADDMIVIPVSSIKYVYHRAFGTLLGWGTTILGVAAMSGS
ncbi:MAG TPA: polysaccharide biosynthesis/export family protein [Candidatus Binatia bacterium]|nr:polysaccharide biosynthesis/export family protein [Candidatus Binatia bacterium]